MATLGISLPRLKSHIETLSTYGRNPGGRGITRSCWSPPHEEARAWLLGRMTEAGLAGLLAGAFSMAAGEYISMRSQREAYEREIALEAEELRNDPEAEAEELALIYRAKGLDAEEAQRVATTIMKDHDNALETMAREELGLDPEELGSPWSAALSSLIAFALGAVVVVLPYLFGTGTAALVTAIVLAAVALFTVGAVLGLLNGKAPLRAGARQLLIGGGAGLGQTHALLRTGRGHPRLRDSDKPGVDHRAPDRVE